MTTLLQAATTVALPTITLTADNHERLSRLADAAADGMSAEADFLAREVDRAVVVDPERIAPQIVTMNSRCVFRDDSNGFDRTVTLVYPEDEDAAAGRISVLTPIGSALIGLAEGQSMSWRTRSGERRVLTLLRVAFQPEAEAHETALVH
ncbi:nucleoside diphosphate kinase regulator [Vineibacter terrae]|uniref:Nucleoside diphosphate kinase regulator n=1 Tax=Vineibacter terrae TaxID=2586908 RepID=A0A5C8PMZ0_9HYPH|nr:nucleoside diphosphate kinase regulator [Vineibacter terrae]TXL75932.1 nucleoside diphosphate kinase regulator [Vineibacter terrae]